MRIPTSIMGSLLIAAVAWSCTSGAAKKAQADFQRADALIAKHELLPAMNLLDSMMVWNEGDYGIVGEALKRKNQVGKVYHQEMIGSSQMLVDGLGARLPELAKDFILIPGEPGQPGTYEHKRQTVRSSWNRIFLKIGISENGDTWLISHYYGKSWINHTSLRVYDNDSYLLTDTIPLGHEWNRKVEDLGDRWETIEFREGSDAGAIAFIADNYQKSVKVRFNGKPFQYIVLESYDKDAFHKGWELAQVLKERYGLLQSIRLHQTELKKLGGDPGAN